MIIKLVKNKHGKQSAKDRIRALINYIAKPTDVDKNEKCFAVYTVNNQGLPEFFLEECYAICALAKKGHLAFDHQILSWPENETPSEKDLERIVSIWSSSINPHGLCFSGLHVNTENLHLHFALQHYFPGGLYRPHSGQNYLYTLHALCFCLETQFGFSHNPNSLVFPHSLQNQSLYYINKGPRSVRTLQPKSPDLLPIIDKYTLPLPKAGSFYYLEGEEKPCVYIADDYLVLLQWYRKELVDLVKDLHCPVYNSKQQKEVALESIPVPLPAKPRKKDIERDFKKGLIQTNPRANQSVREEQAIRYLLDLGYDDREILENYFRLSCMENDRLFMLRAKRNIKSAKRAVNRFRLMVENRVKRKEQFKAAVDRAKNIMLKEKEILATKEIVTLQDNNLQLQ